MPLPTIQQVFDLAVRRHQAGRLRQAELLYREILTQEPAHADSLHLLGVIAYQVGSIDRAIDLFRQALTLQPRLAEAHSNLGNALRDKGLLDEAIAVCRQALALKPHYPEAFNNLGNALLDHGQLDEAVASFQQAAALRPDWPQAHYNLANALRDQRRFEESVAAYRRAIALQPHFPNAFNNLGVALKDMGRLDEAIAAFHQAIALQPDSPEAQRNLGNALKDTGDLDQAITAYRHAITLQPHSPEAHDNLIMALQYHPGYDASAIAAELRAWNRRHAEPLQHFTEPHHNERSPDRRLRIGYVSPDFRDHVVGRILLPLFRHHDHSQFEITCYAQVPRADAMTVQFQHMADRWRNLAPLSTAQTVRQIREDRIDILVDLTLHTAHNRLLVFACKPAPIQATWLGYPGSTGLSTIDYRLTDPYLDPPGCDESIYSEQTLRLPDTFWCYDPLDGRAIPLTPPPARANRFITFGCLNNFCKINDPALTLWARLLHLVHDSRLLLLASPGSHRQRTADFLNRLGIDPARLEFLAPRSRNQYLELYHRLDISLDSFPYNGHTSSLDSFWMGVPVITLIGSTVVGRAGLSQLMNLNLPDLVAHTPDQYLQIAARLAADLPQLTTLRATLRQCMEQSPLMDAPRFARNIESAYRHMWQTWCAESLALR